MGWSILDWEDESPRTWKKTKSMTAHARGSGELARTVFRSLSRPQQPHFKRSSSILLQGVLRFTWICSAQLISYFSVIFSTFLHHLLYIAQLWHARQEWSFCTRKRHRTLIKFFFFLQFHVLYLIPWLDFQYFDAIFHNTVKHCTASCTHKFFLLQEYDWWLACKRQGRLGTWACFDSILQFRELGAVVLVVNVQETIFSSSIFDILLQQ